MTVMLAVADGVHVHFDGVFQELVDEDGMVRRGHQGPIHEVDQGRVVGHDLHGPPAQDVGGPHQHGVGDLVGDGQGLLDGGGGVVGGLLEVQLGQHLLEELPVLGPVDGVGRGPDDADPGLAQGHRQVQGGLAAELEDQALGLFRGHDVEHVFPGQGLEIELVRGVVVGGHGFGVGVDHDGLHPNLLQGEGGLAAAVVELDALADAVGAAAQDHDLVAGRSGGPRLPTRRWSKNRGCRPRTRRRRCPPACRPD